MKYAHIKDFDRLFFNVFLCVFNSTIFASECTSESKNASTIVTCLMLAVAVINLFSLFHREVIKHATENKEPASVAKLSASPSKKIASFNCCMV